MKPRKKIKAAQLKKYKLFYKLPIWQIQGNTWIDALISRGVRPHTAFLWLRKRQTVIQLPSGEKYETDHWAGKCLNMVITVCRMCDIEHKIEWLDSFSGVKKANVIVRTLISRLSVSTSDCIHEFETAEFIAQKILKQSHPEFVIHEQ